MIYANIATIPERKHLLKQVIESIAPQVDMLFVMMNNYKSVPEYITDSVNVLGSLTDNQMGDSEKFLKVQAQEGYIFTMDDDLVYPPDYVETMIAHIERHKRKAIISLHGRTFGKLPIESYYRDKTKTGYHWNVNQDCDVLVDAGGTGVMAWHSDTIKIKYDDIKQANMGDVWMSVFARRAKVDIMCVKHKSNWLRYIGPLEDTTNPKTIWAKHVWDDELQTKVYNDGC